MGRGVGEVGLGRGKVLDGGQRGAERRDKAKRGTITKENTKKKKTRTHTKKKSKKKPEIKPENCLPRGGWEEEEERGG